jgi:putative membrane protein
MWLFGLLTLAGIALLLVVAVRALGGGISRGAATAPRHSRARAVLDERFARGELTPDEYRERLRILEGGQ